MAGETDPVRVVIEIVDNFSDELQKLEAQLDKLDAKVLDIDLDIDDNGDITETEAQLDALEDIINAIVDIDTVGEERAMAIKQILERDMDSTLHIDTDTPSIDLSAEQIQGIREATATSIGRHADMNPFAVGGRDQTLGDVMTTRGFPDGLFGEGAADEFLDNISQATTESMDLHGDDQSALFGDFLARERGESMFGTMFDRPTPVDTLPTGAGAFDFDFGFAGTGGVFGDDVDDPAKGLRNIADKLDELRPSLRTFTNLIALVLPLIITLAGAAIGLAAAFGAVATGAAAIVGVGLLGWGDSATESLQNVRQAATQTAKDIANVFQPLGNRFQPILEDWLAGLPNLSRELVEPLEGMLVFADDLEGMGRGMVDWIINVLTVMQNMEKEAVSVANRAGSALGSFLIETLAAMLNEVHKNQDAYVKIGEILVDFAVIIFNVFKAVTFAIAKFEFLFDIIAGLTNLISGPFLGTVLAVIASVAILEGVLALASIGFIGVAEAALAASGSIASTYLPRVYSAVQATWAWVTAANTLAGSLLRVAAISGIGLLVAGAGMAAANAMEPEGIQAPGVGGGAGSGAQGNTFINVEGDVGRREADRILDEVGPVAQNEMGISEARSR